MFDPLKIFNLFDKPLEDEIKENLDTYKNTEKFKLEMFIKIVIYGDSWKKGVIKLFSNSNFELDLEDINKAGEFMLYSRAWIWIKQFKTDDIGWGDAIKEIDSNEFLIALSRTINHFEISEEFEKCAFLCTIKELLKKA